MRRLAPILALCLVAACGRDFSLPPAPKDQPRFLGPLAGFYQVSVPLDVITQSGLDTGLETPVATVLVIQDLVPPDGGADPVVGTFQDVETPTGAGLSRRVQAPLVGTYASRALTGARIFGPGAKATVTGTPVAGGQDLSLSYQVCPGEALAPLPVSVRKVCDFEPQVSGVYAGHSGSCSDPTGGDPAWMALGVRTLDPRLPDLVMGLAYPKTSQVLVGSFDPFGGCGAGRLYDLDQGRSVTAGFGLADDGKTLTFDLRQGPGPAIPSLDLCHPGIQSCDGRFLGTRKRGTAPDQCPAPALHGLSVAWKVTGLRTHRYLDVHVHVFGAREDVDATSHQLGFEKILDRTLLHGVLAPADGSAALSPVSLVGAPATVALRFDLGSGGGTVAYRLAVWAALGGVPFAGAMPACVVVSPP